MHMMHMGPKSTLNRAYFDTKIPCWDHTRIEAEELAFHIISSFMAAQIWSQ